MKKFLLIMLNIVLVGMIAFLSLVLYHRYQDKQISQFIEQKERVFKKRGETNFRTGNVGSTHIVASIPTDVAGRKIGLIENRMVDYVHRTLGEDKPTGKINRIFFVTSRAGKTNLKKVKAHEIRSERYRLSQIDIEKDGEETVEQLLLTEDQQLFTLGKLFSDTGVAKELILAAIKEEMTQRNIPEAEQAQLLAQCQATELEQLAFSYENSRFTIQLPANTILPSVDIAVATLFPVLKGEYLSDVDETALEEYRQQQEVASKKNLRQIALTFDDGPNPATTPKILDLLKRYNAKATFFVIGRNIAGNEAILQRMIAEGHEIGNHSWSHPNLTTLAPEAIVQEIESTQVAVEQATGRRPNIVRPPYGAVNQKVAQAMNLPSIYWNVDTQDWSSHNPQAILAQVKSGAKAGCIILMHDIHQSTVDSLETVLQYLTTEGYSMVTATEALGDHLNPHYVYYDQESAGPAQQ